MGAFGDDGGGAGPQEGIEHEVAAPAAAEDDTGEQLFGFLGGVQLAALRVFEAFRAAAGGDAPDGAELFAGAEIVELLGDVMAEGFAPAFLSFGPR